MIYLFFGIVKGIVEKLPTGLNDDDDVMSKAKFA